MTVTVFNATFADAMGTKFHGTISWDKYTPRKLDAVICPYVSANEVDYPVWSSHSANSSSGMNVLIARMKKKAKAMKLNLTDEALTKFAPKEELPDPTEKTVLITTGEFAGHEGTCLGKSGESGEFAVSPHGSNRILTLRFDQDFGILLNSRQHGGRN